MTAPAPTRGGRSGSLIGEKLLRRIDVLVDQLTKRGEDIMLREIRREVRQGPVVLALRHLQSGKPLTDDLVRRLSAVRMDEGRLNAIFTDAFTKAGRATSKVYQNLVRFDTDHPRVREWAATQSVRKVQEINTATQEGVRQLIVQAMKTDMSPQQLAAQLRSSVGLTFRQTQMVEDYRQRMIQRGVISSVANAKATHYADSLLTQRVSAIAETEIVSAIEAGKMEYWDQAVDAGLISAPRYVWIIENDDRVDEQCSLMAFAEADAYGYFDTPIGPQKHPPLHPHCRCQVVLESDRSSSRGVRGSLARQGGFTSHLVTGHKPPDGWMVAIPGHEATRAYGVVTDDWINEYKSANRDLLSRSGHYWGGWVEETSRGRNVYLDVSRNVKGLDDAVALGRLYRQKAVHNIATGETLNLDTMEIEKVDRVLVGMVIPLRWEGLRVRRELELIVDRYLR